MAYSEATPSSTKAKSAKSKSKRSAGASSSSASATHGNQSSSAILSSGFLLTCDPPVKQFIIYLNDAKIADKKFIIEDLDATHLLIKGGARDEIHRKVEEWMDENVFSNIERVGENLDTS